jgi:hypothetical protein
MPHNLDEIFGSEKSKSFVKTVFVRTVNCMQLVELLLNERKIRYTALSKPTMYWHRTASNAHAAAAADEMTRMCMCGCGSPGASSAQCTCQLIVNFIPLAAHTENSPLEIHSAAFYGASATF